MPDIVATDVGPDAGPTRFAITVIAATVTIIAAKRPVTPVASRLAAHAATPPAVLVAKPVPLEKPLPRQVPKLLPLRHRKLLPHRHLRMLFRRRRKPEPEATEPSPAWEDCQGH